VSKKSLNGHQNIFFWSQSSCYVLNDFSEFDEAIILDPGLLRRVEVYQDLRNGLRGGSDFCRIDLLCSGKVLRAHDMVAPVKINYLFDK